MRTWLVRFSREIHISLVHSVLQVLGNDGFYAAPTYDALREAHLSKKLLEGRYAMICHFYTTFVRTAFLIVIQWHGNFVERKRHNIQELFVKKSIQTGTKYTYPTWQQLSLPVRLLVSLRHGQPQINVQDNEPSISPEQSIETKRNQERSVSGRPPRLEYTAAYLLINIRYWLARQEGGAQNDFALYPARIPYFSLLPPSGVSVSAPCRSA